MILTKLNEQIKDFTGRGVMLAPSLTATPKTAILHYLSIHTPANGAQSAAIWSLGARLHEAEDELEIKDDEYNLIKSILKKPKLAVVAHEPLCQWLEGQKNGEE